ncbi:MAG: CehA/McbA family metallohydrolase [Symbiobacteriia bacterium]
MSKTHELAGVIHCHSTYSDGAATVPEILRAAQQAGLEYLLLTDHDTLAPRAPSAGRPGDSAQRGGSPGQGYQGGLLFLVGSEVSPPQNHYLVLGASDSPPRDWSLQRVIDAAVAAGGIGFVAHPNDRGSRFMHVDSYPWRDQDVTGYTGIEVWNFFSQLLGEITSAPRAVRAALFPYTLVRGPQPETVDLWDRLGQQRRVPAIGGIDAHGLQRGLLWLPLVATNYRLALRSVWTHVLLPAKPSGDWQQDAATVYEALAAGHVFISAPAAGDAHGFRFIAQIQAGELQMGDEGRLEGQAAELAVTCPGRATVRLVRDGKTLASKHGVRGFRLSVKEPGVYRVEVYRRRFFQDHLWILSNPIYLRP